ncbi:hypothetical protein L2728_11260, partial [Shewanella chilikensis]|nr:hypothetical protein [Shewanella chilikensis]
LYNHQLPQSALDSKPPIMAMKEWHKTHPELFKKRPYNHAGLDSYINAHTKAAARRSQIRI